MLEDIKQRHTQYSSNPNVYDWIHGEEYVDDVKFLLQELEKANTIIQQLTSTTSQYVNQSVSLDELHQTMIKGLQEENKRYKEALETVYDYIKQTEQELTKRVILAALREPEEV